MRYAFFEEFKSGPKVLFWGQPADMPQLAALLRRASSTSGAFRFKDEPNFHSADGSEITLMCGNHPDGMYRTSPASFQWRMTPDAAVDFADLVEVLANGEHGHQYLDGWRESARAITVMVSAGEYPDDLI
jgi:hypothetical protein